MYRLPPRAGDWLDRSRELGFEFEGRRVPGFAGDTITSALAAVGRDDAGPQLQISPSARHLLLRQSRRQQPVRGRRRSQRARRRHAADAANSRVVAVNTRGGVEARSHAVHRMAGAIPARGFLLQGVSRPRISRAGRNASAPSRASAASMRATPQHAHGQALRVLRRAGGGRRRQRHGRGAVRGGCRRARVARGREREAGWLRAAGAVPPRRSSPR